jgi:two-component system phosphate regulon sensor histidine kinase PhoR
LIFEEETQRLVFKVTTGTKSSEIKKLVLSTDKGIAGWVFRKGEPLLVNDTRRDKRFHKEFDKSTGFMSKSIIAVPLKHGERVVGVMELVNKIDGGFVKEDLEDVLSFALICSVVIENIELYKYLRTLVNKVKSLEDYQRILLESLTDGVLSINSKNRVVSCNKSIQVMLKKDRDSIIGKNIAVFFDTEDSVEKIVKECRTKGKLNDFFCYLKSDINNRFPVAIDLSLFRYDSTKKGIVIVVRNLKSALNQEEMKREAILRSDLVYNVSHEFKTPLTAIQAGIQIMKATNNQDGKSKYFNIIEDNVEILNERIQTFLDYLKAEKDEWEVKPERIQFCQFLEQVISRLKKSNKEHKFALSLPEFPIFIYADKAQVKKVLVVIYKNAIQYSKEGTEIKTRVDLNNRFINLYIEDKGRGVSENNIQHIFDKFQRFSDTLKETESGLGIGLWIAKYLMEKNKAKIKIISKKGKGTTVRLSFRKE